VKPGTKPKRSAELVDRVFRMFDLEVGPSQSPVKIGELAPAVCIVRGIRVALSPLQRTNAGAVLTELITGDREVEGGLEIARVHLESLLETPSGFRKSRVEVVDDAKAIEDVRVT
jgi:hypothetical protein